MKYVLFVCVHNAGRSQMAEAVFNSIARESIAKERGLEAKAESAGTEPATRVHPEVVEVMRELGVDLADRKPRLLTNEMVERADKVITMGCAPDAAACPAIFVKGVEDWNLPDPKGQPLDRVRQIRDDIRQRVEALLRDMESQARGLPPD